LHFLIFHSSLCTVVASFQHLLLNIFNFFSSTRSSVSSYNGNLTRLPEFLLNQWLVALLNLQCKFSILSAPFNELYGAEKNVPTIILHYMVLSCGPPSVLAFITFFLIISSSSAKNTVISVLLFAHFFRCHRGRHFNVIL
jgi:hypothetical protein